MKCGKQLMDNDEQGQESTALQRYIRRSILDRIIDWIGDIDVDGLINTGYYFFIIILLHSGILLIFQTCWENFSIREFFSRDDTDEEDEEPETSSSDSNGWLPQWDSESSESDY